MDGLREPVGEQPPEVYWRRRMVVFGGVVLLVLVIWFLITSPPGEGTGDDASPAPTVDVSPAANATIDAAASRPCTGDDVRLTTTANPRNYPAGTLPSFDVLIEHLGTSACLLDTGADSSSLLIMSGPDRIYHSDDCENSSAINARQFLLSSDASEDFQVSWSRQRSNEDCTTVTAEPQPGTYRATLVLQGIESEVAVFELAG